jgi:hypothetical protein
MARKGKKVHFIGGKYGGKKGWVNDDRILGTGTISVIVDLGKKRRKGNLRLRAYCGSRSHGKSDLLC